MMSHAMVGEVCRGGRRTKALHEFNRFSEEVHQEVHHVNSVITQHKAVS